MPRKPSITLADIKFQMTTPAGLKATQKAIDGARALGLTAYDMVEVVQSLEDRHFFKSAPCTKYPDQNPHDTYRIAYNGQNIYLKFQEKKDFFVIRLVSFKEDESA